jgi:hypothetical protein
LNSKLFDVACDARQFDHAAFWRAHQKSAECGAVYAYANSEPFAHTGGFLCASDHKQVLKNLCAALAEALVVDVDVLCPDLLNWGENQSSGQAGDEHTLSQAFNALVMLNANAGCSLIIPLSGKNGDCCDAQFWVFKMPRDHLATDWAKRLAMIANSTVVPTTTLPLVDSTNIHTPSPTPVPSNAASMAATSSSGGSASVVVIVVVVIVVALLAFGGVALWFFRLRNDSLEYSEPSTIGAGSSDDVFSSARLDGSNAYAEVHLPQSNETDIGSPSSSTHYAALSDAERVVPQHYADADGSQYASLADVNGTQQHYAQVFDAEAVERENARRVLEQQAIADGYEAIV